MDRVLAGEFLELLTCPTDGTTLRSRASELECAEGHRFPVHDGIPVLLPEGVTPTQPNIFAQSRHWASESDAAGSVPVVTDDFARSFVQDAIRATAGRLYGLDGRALPSYPIPHFPLPDGASVRLLDIGCNWGRWSVAAAQNGFRPVGVDPNLKAVLAARHVARELGVDADFIVGDARFLPIRDDTFEVVFSYSVLQHFSRADVRKTLSEVARVLAPSGCCLVQMPNRFGLVSLFHQARRGFRTARGFEVRYWSPAELQRTFTSLIGEVSLKAEGFFGLGVGGAAPDCLGPGGRMVVRVSNFLTKLSSLVPPLKLLADSLYVRARAPTALEEDGH